MSRFTGPLRIEEIEPGRRWRLLEPIQYEAGSKGSGLFVVIPAGFETDGATIPAALRVFLAVWGTYGRAACLHDWLYSGLASGNREPFIPNRRAADGEFYIAMRACGTSSPLAFVMWCAVRMFGAARARSRK